jgi:hypothetical protein
MKWPVNGSVTGVRVSTDSRYAAGRFTSRHFGYCLKTGRLLKKVCILPGRGSLNDALKV